jgi:glycosyltransferase involved in cell wall biosynthesis
MAAAVHFLNETEAAESTVYTSPSQEHFVLPSGIDLSISQGVSEVAFREEHPELRGRKILLFVGRLHWSKDLDLQVTALRRLVAEDKNVCLVLVGPDEGVWGTLRTTVKSMDLEDHVLWTGALPRARVLEALAAAHAFTLSSRHEAHSMAMNEALAMGLPVVLTESVGFPRIAEWGAGIIVPSDEVSLAAAWKVLLDEEATALTMGKTARRAAEEHLSWDSIAMEMHGHYDRILKGRNG